MITITHLIKSFTLWEFVKTQFLPGTGRGTARSVVEGAHSKDCTLAERWDPSVSPAAIHLPVPGRI